MSFLFSARPLLSNDPNNFHLFTFLQGGRLCLGHLKNFNLFVYIDQVRGCRRGLRALGCLPECAVVCCRGEAVATVARRHQRTYRSPWKERIYKGLGKKISWEGIRCTLFAFCSTIDVSSRSGWHDLSNLADAKFYLNVVVHTNGRTPGLTYTNVHLERILIFFNKFNIANTIT